jgi:hypothetical protein
LPEIAPLLLCARTASAVHLSALSKFRRNVLLDLFDVRQAIQVEV